MLRGLGRTERLPGDDIGARRNIQELLGLKEEPDYEKVGRITRRWQPYSGFVYFHLLLAGLEKNGLI